MRGWAFTPGDSMSKPALLKKMPGTHVYVRMRKSEGENSLPKCNFDIPEEQSFGERRMSFINRRI